jgi:hypothetical protein
MVEFGLVREQIIATAWDSIRYGAQWMPRLSLFPMELTFCRHTFLIDSVNQTMQDIKETIDHNRSSNCKGGSTFMLTGVVNKSDNNFD